jgi:hypothetical protein
LEHDEKALIDLVDGLSSRSVVLVSVTNDNLANHDALLGGGIKIHLSFVTLFLTLMKSDVLVIF